LDGLESEQFAVAKTFRYMTQEPAGPLTF